MTDELARTKHALRIYEETARKLGEEVDASSASLERARAQLASTRKSAARKRGALRRLEGAYLAIVRLYLEKCRECGAALPERDQARGEAECATKAMEAMGREHAEEHARLRALLLEYMQAVAKLRREAQDVVDARQEAYMNGSRGSHRRAQAAESRVATADRANVVLKARLDGALRALESERRDTVIWATDRLREAVLEAAKHDGERTADERVRAVIDVAREVTVGPRPGAARAFPVVSADFAPGLRGGMLVEHPDGRRFRVAGFQVPNLVVLQPRGGGAENILPADRVYEAVCHEFGDHGPCAVCDDPPTGPIIEGARGLDAMDERAALVARAERAEKTLAKAREYAGAVSHRGDVSADERYVALFVLAILDEGGV